jgi:hypothetical protein
MTGLLKFLINYRNCILKIRKSVKLPFYKATILYFYCLLTPHLLYNVWLICPETY